MRESLTLIANSIRKDKDKDKDRNKDKHKDKDKNENKQNTHDKDLHLHQDDDDDDDDGDEKDVTLDMEIIGCTMLRSSFLVHNIKYSGCLTDNNHSACVTRMSILSNDIFQFSNDDCVIMKYDENDNTFSIELHCNKIKKNNSNSNQLQANIDVEKQQSQARTIKDGIDMDSSIVSNSDKNTVVNVTDSSLLKQDSPIKAEKNKLILEKGYDYVLACSIEGCDKRVLGMNNVYTFSSKHQNCL